MSTNGAFLPGGFFPKQRPAQVYAGERIGPLPCTKLEHDSICQCNACAIEREVEIGAETPPEAFKVAVYVPVTSEMLMDSPTYAKRHPWLRPDPNPMPRIRLWRHGRRQR